MPALIEWSRKSSNGTYPDRIPIALSPTGISETRKEKAPNQPNKIDQSRPHEEFESCQAVSTREKELQRDITLDPHGIPPSTSNTSPKDRSPTIEEKEKEVKV